MLPLTFLQSDKQATILKQKAEFVGLLQESARIHAFSDLVYMGHLLQAS